MRHLTNTRDRISNLRECIRDKQTDQHGMTIVEVMVAFVLVLLAIATITTATSMATKIQKNTQESQKRTAYLAELAYQKLQPNYDETEKRWKIAIPSSELSNISAATQLHFTGNGTSFAVDVKTADWTVEANLESAGAIRTKYYIYQSLPKSEAGNPVVPGEQHRSRLDAYVVEGSVMNSPPSLRFHIPPFTDDGQDCDQWKLNIPAEVTDAWKVDIYKPGTDEKRNDLKDFYGIEKGDHCIIIKTQGRGFTEEVEVDIRFEINGLLTEEQMKELEKTKYVESAPSYEYASPSNTTVHTHYIKNEGPPYEAEISYTIAAGEKRLKEYLEVEFNTKIIKVTGHNEKYVQPISIGNKLYVYGCMLETGESNNVTLTVYLENPDENNPSVRPSEPIIQYRN